MLDFCKVCEVIFGREESSSQDSGSIIVKVVFSPGLEAFTKILPLWYSSIILLARDRPRPHPLFLVLYPGLNTDLNLLEGMPWPVSERSIHT